MDTAQMDWKGMNFHQVMVKICDDFQMSHAQMVNLRQRLEKIYGGQQVVSVKAMAIWAYRQLENEKRFETILQTSPGKVIKQARKIDTELLLS